jgi:DNA gyrase subunit A
VIGKYHPHGDSAVYDTIVRMAQPFSLRYMLVDGQGNFGSIDGDPPRPCATPRCACRARPRAAGRPRQGNRRLGPNYDGTEQDSRVLPTRVPNLLVNGSSGIAVGMATNIPPHNLGEVIDACTALIDDPEAFRRGPDGAHQGSGLPDRGIINGRAGIHLAYRPAAAASTCAPPGVEDDEKDGRESIIVTELPYQVNKARLIEKIAELVKEKRIEGISELRDESDKDGMRIFIEVKRASPADVVLNNLYAQTQMETVFGINMVALEDGQPKQLLNLKQILEAFVRHRREVVTRRTDLRTAQGPRAWPHPRRPGRRAGEHRRGDRADQGSPNAAEAKGETAGQDLAAGAGHCHARARRCYLLQARGAGEGFGLNPVGTEYRLSPAQAQAILELRLHRLTGLETGEAAR